MSRNSWNRVPYRERQAIKAQLLARDGLTCCLCLQPIASVRQATIEHKIKRKHNRVDVRDIRNLGLAHPACNYSNRFDALNPRQVVDGLPFFDQ